MAVGVGVVIGVAVVDGVMVGVDVGDDVAIGLVEIKCKYRCDIFSF